MFKRLKHRLRLEAVTGLDYLALQQDLGAKILIDNLCTLLSELDAPHDEECASRPNRVYAPGALKPILGACLLRVRRCLPSLVGVLAVIHQTRCRIQPSRSYPRPPRKAKPHFHSRVQTRLMVRGLKLRALLIGVAVIRISAQRQISTLALPRVSASGQFYEVEI
ncbi:MAG TPA: hypothetical protein VHV99_18970 [Paraburkholderia sp.]|nr:hypothetical protein [Paraburkholderia sp.]